MKVDIREEFSMIIQERPARGTEPILSTTTGVSAGPRQHVRKDILSKARPTLLVVGAAALLQLTGCASQVYFYDEARDKQAADAKTKVQALDEDAVIAAQQANLTTLLGEELKVQDELALIIRNQRLRSFIAAPLREPLPKGGKQKQNPPSSLLDLVEAETVDLLKPCWLDVNPATKKTRLDVAMLQWQDAKEHEQLVAEKLGIVSVIYDQFGMGTPSCDDVAPGSAPPPATKAALSAAAPGDKAVIDTARSSLSKTCAAVAQRPVFDGKVEAAYSAYKQALNEKTLAEQPVKLAKQKYQDALDAYNTAVKDNTAGATNDTKANVDKASTDLLTAINGLESLQTASSMQFLAQERLDSLKDFVTTLNQGVDAGKVPADNKNKAAASLILLANLVADAQKSLADAKSPLNLPLQIYRDQQQFILQAATLDLDAQRKEVEFRKQIYDTMVLQVRELWLARRELTFVDPNDKSVNMPRLETLEYGAALDKASLAEKKLLLSGTRRYLDTIYWYDAQRYKLEYQRLGATYDRGLAYAAVDMKRWKALVDATTGQVAEFYAGGIKPATLVALLQAAGVVWVGQGVNK